MRKNTVLCVAELLTELFNDKALHDATSQKTTVFILFAVRGSILTCFIILFIPALIITCNGRKFPSDETENKLS
jgi:hypothetical protein